LVSAEGRIIKRSYKNKEGQNVSITEITVDSINSISSKSQATGEHASTPIAQFASNINEKDYNNSENQKLEEINWFEEEK
jgi:single-stranded DNA-binding protein